MERGAFLQVPTDENDSSGTVIIPRIDGEVPIINHEGAYVHLQDIEAHQVSRDEQLLRHHIKAVYRDDFLLNNKSGSQMYQRPRSLAVPGITTSSALLQEPQGPVMSISPQATYLSTIIPNAILPSAIDVIEIDENLNRRSVRTVSKSSLVPASPASSRSEGGTRDEPTSTSFKWSHSQSSETIVSHPSTISFKGSMPCSHVTDSIKEVTDLNDEQMSVKSSVSWSSSNSKAGSQRLEQGELSDVAVITAQNSRLFSRNLSVMKAKLPPAPPRRTYSLQHENLKQKPTELAGAKDLKYVGSDGRQPDVNLNMKKDHTSPYTKNISTQSPVSHFFNDLNLSATASPHRPIQDSVEVQSDSNNSSPQDIFERTLSPSSGYSSQSGTPTHSSKDIYPTSPGKQKLKPPKPERTGTRISPAVSVSSSLVSLSSNVSDTASQLTQTHTIQSQPPKIFPAALKNNMTPPTTATIRELFNIPPPPRIKAPCPPPPETWAHNERTTELLCGPSPSVHKIYELQKHRQTDVLLMKNWATANITNLSSEQRQISVETETNVTHSGNKALPPEKKDDHMPVQEQVVLQEREEVSHVIHKRVHERSEDLKREQESPVTSKKLQSADKDNEILPLKQQFVSEACHLSSGGLPETNFSTPERERTDTEDQCFVKHSTHKEILEQKNTHNLNVDSPKAVGISPPSLPEHSSPSPPSKISSVCSVSVLLHEKEVQSDMEKELLPLEPSWPPPPPPIYESSDLVFEGQEETDFPLPPPPDIQDSFIVMSEGYNVAPENLPDLSNKVSHTEQNLEPQIIQSTTVAEKTINESFPVDSIPSVSNDKLFDQTHAKPQSSETVSQVCIDLLGSETPVPSEMSQKSSKSQEIPLQTLPQEPHDPVNPPEILPKDLAQKIFHAPENSTDLKTTLPVDDQSTFNFRRQQSTISKESKCKGLLSTQKCTPIPKEDANIPLVTPSLLHMVRLRTVNVEDQELLSQEGAAVSETTSDQDLSVFSQVTPQKPLRKSCIKTMQSPLKSPSACSGPSMRLQEAIRMKTAAMSSSSFPARPSLRLPTTTANNNDVPVQSPKTPDECKSPASTASFIFSKSTKKVVIETATSPEAQASLKQSLAAELMQISDQQKSVVANGTKKPHKVPPPIAKKPVHATSPSGKLGTVTKLTIVGSLSKQNNGVANNQQLDRVQPAGQ